MMYSVFVVWRALVLDRLGQCRLVPEPGTSGVRYPRNLEPVVLGTRRIKKAPVVLGTPGIYREPGSGILF